jgi:hypothetical protein
MSRRFGKIRLVAIPWLSEIGGSPAAEKMRQKQLIDMT